MTNAQNTENTDFTVTREIREGLNGSGRTIWVVQSEWTDRNWRKRGTLEYFETRAEAENWVKWA